jgi:hypothetical protein
METFIAVVGLSVDGDNLSNRVQLIEIVCVKSAYYLAAD